MRALGAAIAVTGLGLAVSLATPALFGDRSALVAPPDARVESFTRELATHRSALALRYLSDGLRRTTSAAALAEAFATIESQLGEVDNVDAERVWQDASRAAARSDVVAGRHHVILDFGLSWEHGQWAISDLPPILGGARHGAGRVSARRRGAESDPRVRRGRR